MEYTELDKMRNACPTLEYHREPTLVEIIFGQGATHYRDFPLYVCLKPDGTMKQWLVCPGSGLRYYR